MADFQALSNYEVNDDYYTPKHAWEQINHLIPKDKVVWEAFMLGSKLSKSKSHLIELGNNVIGETDWNFFDDAPSYDLIVSNPPFDKNIKIPILQRLVELDKPFILIMNICNVFANYFNDIFKENRKHLQIVFPKGKIHFEKLVGNTTEYKQNTSFHCVYVTYKMNIPNEKLWL